MSWSDVYLLCFLVGFSLCVVSFLAGAVHLHLPFKGHLPVHGGHHGGGAGAARVGHGGHISWFNASSVLAFLAWFGGTGYILTKHSSLVALACLSIAVAAGLVAGWLVFRFMARLVKNSDAQMNEWDYRQEGTVGTVSISIQPGGTGEIIFEQQGARSSAGARSEDGAAIEKGAEVVISRYEKGIAYVRRWEEFTGAKS
ncbi:MAG TPA: NfeD family protein [Candidatus Acidoferrum sp.]|nr:NfeD family protein [Candidatus Acidoferrum sp.]